MLLKHEIEDVQPPGHELGQGEQAQGVPRGCRVEDHQGITLLSDELRDLDHRHQLVEAGQRELEELADVVVVEVGAEVHDRRDGVAVAVFERLQAFARVDRPGEELGLSADGRDPVADRLFERVRE